MTPTMSRSALGSAEPPSRLGGLGLEARAVSVGALSAASLRARRGRDRSAREPRSVPASEPPPRVARPRRGATRRDDPARPPPELGRRRVVGAPESRFPLSAAPAPPDRLRGGRDPEPPRSLPESPPTRSRTGFGALSVIRSTVPPASGALTCGTSSAAADVAETPAMQTTAADAASQRAFAPLLETSSNSAKREPRSPASDARAWCPRRTDRGRRPLEEGAILRNGRAMRTRSSNVRESLSRASRARRLFPREPAALEPGQTGRRRPWSLPRGGPAASERAGILASSFTGQGAATGRSAATWRAAPRQWGGQAMISTRLPAGSVTNARGAPQ